jgi:hypothetical protein
MINAVAVSVENVNLREVRRRRIGRDPSSSHVDRDEGFTA